MGQCISWRRWEKKSSSLNWDKISRWKEIRKESGENMVYLRSAAELHQGIMDAKEKELQNQGDSLNRDVSVSQYQI